MQIAERPSPNFNDRRNGAGVDLVVLHYTAMPDAEVALCRLCDDEAEVSAHYLVAKDGAVTRMVAEDKRAWHAGEGRWAGRDDVNSRSLGIELDNDGDSHFEDAQMEALEALLDDILQRHALHPKSVIAHSDMAPGRKSDPGRLFEWKRLADKGLSIWPEAGMPGDFLRNAAAFGYPVELGETLVLDAFRQRFRPFATGPLDAPDRAMMAGLARHWPADVTERIASRIPSRTIRGA